MPPFSLESEPLGLVAPTRYARSRSSTFPARLRLLEKKVSPFSHAVQKKENLITSTNGPFSWTVRVRKLQMVHRTDAADAVKWSMVHRDAADGPVINYKLWSMVHRDAADAVKWSMVHRDAADAVKWSMVHFKDAVNIFSST